MKISNLIIYFICFFGYSQNLLVEYKYSQNIGKDFNEYSHFLLANKDESYYIMPSHKFFRSYEDLYADSDYKTHNTRKSMYKKIDSNNLYFYGYLPKSKASFEEKFVHDSINIQYNIQQDNDIILEYKCNIAKAKFRGRNYKIWFTKEISIPVGPWKFFGLPGLILKVEDTSGIFSFTATRIVQNNNFTIVDKISKSFQDSSVSEAISFKDYVKLENNKLTNFRDQVIASLPKGTIVQNMKSIRNDLIESEFEWEEEPKIQPW